MQAERKEQTPSRAFKEYEECTQYKSSLGEKGIFEQSKKNERFYAGDQWYGAKVGNDRPLVRHNIIKRIADYKIAVLNSSPLSVNYSADGVPNTIDMQETSEMAFDGLSQGQDTLSELDSNSKINIIMEALTNYYKTTSERMGFDDILNDSLVNAYISGTGILYTYWNENIETGLYADANKTIAIKGDIETQVIDVENVNLGDPTESDIQKQPYIIFSVRKSVEELKREAKSNGISADDYERIKPDSETQYMSGDRAHKEPASAKKTICLIKLYKEYEDDGSFKVMCLKCTKECFIKKPFDIGIKTYPVAQFNWNKRHNCGYGDSEITYLIPNQIAINRMLTANTWAVMMLAMPMMIVNDDVIGAPLTNAPGQVISFSGSTEDFDRAVKYITPPDFSANYANNIDSLIQNTLTQSGANESALGDIRADNTSAILAVREASTMPMNIFKNRYFKLVEDNARIWAQFWCNKYGNRQLKVEDARGTYYVPFSAEEYNKLIISTRVDVGASNMWSEVSCIQILDSLYSKQVITPEQYLERLPKGIIPNTTGLIKDLQKLSQDAGMQQFNGEDLINALSPEEQEAFNSLPPEQQQRILGGSENELTASV